MESLFPTLRRAVRRLRKDPAYSITVIATLALGIGAVAAIFSLVNAVLLRPLPYPDSGRLVALRHASSRVELAATQLSRGSYAHYREHNRAFEEVGLYRGNILLTLTDRDEPQRVNIALTTPSVFWVLRARPHLGRLFTAEDAEPDAPSPILISYDLWAIRYGADPGIIGQTIELGSDHRVVAGVMPRGFHFPTPETQLWYTMKVHETRASLQYLDHEGIARLKPGVSLDEADRDLERLVRLLPETYPEVTPEMLREMGLRAEAVPFKQTIVGDVRTELWLLLATAGFVLLVAWANAANLSLVRAERQRKDVAVQRALGATGGHLARGFFSESLVLAALGGALGLGIAFMAVETRFGFEPDQIPRLRELSVGGAVLGLGLGLALLTGVLLGLVSLMHARSAA
jgi:predicted permease